ncbi:GntR family transcriptional regulator [Actinomadura scrupuli]|uniref:GntR family transcriptional regulator n=1 Tax=Actinomadura scrupuli TaxID=559629 RepID=UPI003D98EDFC
MSDKGVPEPAARRRPAYELIADDLRTQIREGVYPADARLPTMARLAAEYEVSDIVIRRSIATLKSEGLVETHGRGGIRVREAPRARRVAMSRYTNPVSATAPEPAEQATAFTRDHQITWSQYRLDKEFSRVTASPEIAGLLGREPGTELLRRHFIFYAADVPSQISVNYLPWDIVGGTPVADPAREPWPGGTAAQCAFLGHPLTRVEESVRSRMPTSEEARILRMPTGVPVLTITRRMLSAATVMEVCRDIVIPADRVILDYAIDLAPRGPES